MPRPPTDHASRDTRLHAAKGAVADWKTLLGARREDLLGDALAALHAEARGARSLEALRPLAEDWELRAALFELTARAKHAPYVHRAATELALAFEAVSPWEALPRQRATDALARLSDALGSAPEEIANTASLAALFASTVALSVWAKVAAEGDLPWAPVPLIGFLALAAVAWEGSGRGRGRSAFQRGMAKAARASGGAWGFGALALIAYAAVTPLGLGMGLLFAIMTLVLSLFPAIATFALAAALRRAFAAASRPLRRLSRRVTGAAPRVPRATAWTFTAVRVTREDAAREVEARREARRTCDTKLREVESALRGGADAPAAPAAEEEKGPYRRRDATGDAVGGTTHEDDALESLMRGQTATARRLRERYLAHLAHEAAATEDDEAAARLVDDGIARLERAGVAMTLEERRGVARVAAWSRGGIRRLQRLAGEPMVTDDAPLSPTNVRVQDDVMERAAERDEADDAERVTGAARGAPRVTQVRPRRLAGGVR